MVSLVSQNPARDRTYGAADESTFGRVIALMSDHTSDHSTSDAAQKGSIAGVVVLGVLRVSCANQKQTW
jgi:hypothetical protein